MRVRNQDSRVRQHTIEKSKMAEQILEMFSIVKKCTAEHLTRLSHPLIRYMSSQEDATELLSGIKFRCREFNRLLMSVSNEHTDLHGKTLESLLMYPFSKVLEDRCKFVQS